MAIPLPLEILKSLWIRRPDGRWAIESMKGLRLFSGVKAEERYFQLSNALDMLTPRPNGKFADVLSLFGPTDFLMQQSIVPVIAWIEGDSAIRCIGTASVISCTGYVITAAHVVLDPLEAGYGAVRKGERAQYREDLNFGVLIPYWAPGRGMSLYKAYRYFPFLQWWAWGRWKSSPLPFEEDRWEYLTDIAICKISELPNNQAHQPLNMSLNSFTPGEDAYALGYSEMPDIGINPKTGEIVDDSFRLNLYVTIGNILTTFPQNHIAKEVPTPGPCFDFDARVPGKMSGAPVFGAKGAIIRGVVSRSFSGENHAYGSMLGPAMDLPMDESENSGRSLRKLLETGNEGMARVSGDGL